MLAILSTPVRRRMLAPNPWAARLGSEVVTALGPVLPDGMLIEIVGRANVLRVRNSCGVMTVNAFAALNFPGPLRSRLRRSALKVLQTLYEFSSADGCPWPAVGAKAVARWRGDNLELGYTVPGTPTLFPLPTLALAEFR